VILATSSERSRGRYGCAHSAGGARNPPSALDVTLTECIRDPRRGLEACDDADKEVSGLDVRELCDGDSCSSDDI
jgi:hypothetical protein